jgi:hypothetical protein
MGPVMTAKVPPQPEITYSPVSLEANAEAITEAEAIVGSEPIAAPKAPLAGEPLPEPVPALPAPAELPKTASSLRDAYCRSRKLRYRRKRHAETVKPPALSPPAQTLQSDRIRLRRMPENPTTSSFSCGRIERLRLTYNARLVSHREVRPGGLLRFQPCDVAVEGIWATATCETASGSPDNVEPGMWTFNLMKPRGTWAIKSIGAR